MPVNEIQPMFDSLATRVALLDKMSDGITGTSIVITVCNHEALKKNVIIHVILIIR